jgi:carboxyl-terminal processing protease
LIYRSVFFHYAAHYLANRTVDKNFQVDDAVIKDFKDYLTSQSIPWNETELNGAMDWLRVSIKEYIVTSQFGQLQGLRVLADWDPMIQKALTFLPEAQALEDTAHKVLAQKAQARNTGVEGVPVQP